MKRIVLFFALVLPLMLQAQPRLTLNQAIDSALQNNLDIRIARNYVLMAKAGNNFGYAGGLPYINAGATDNFNYINSFQQLNTGTETSENGIRGNSLNAYVSANITLFNGFKVLATKKRLDLLHQQSQTELNGQVQDIMAAVMIKYYDIIRQQSYLRIMQSTLEVSQEKLDIVNEKSKIGMASGVITLQARSDVNTALQNLSVQQLNIDQAKADLLLLMNARNTQEFNITDSIMIDPSLNIDTITAFLQHNPQLISAEQQVRISRQLIKETAAQRYPSLKLNAAYNFGRADYSGGYTLVNQNYGPVAGLTLQVPIFNSNVYRTQKTIAGLTADNALLQKENLSLELHTAALKTYREYMTTLQQIETQQTNAQLAEKLVGLVLQNFQLGQATILDVKTAQATYESAAYQLINFLYAAKTAEIELKQMTYQLR